MEREANEKRAENNSCLDGRLFIDRDMQLQIIHPFKGNILECFGVSGISTTRYFVLEFEIIFMWGTKHVVEFHSSIFCHWKIHSTLSTFGERVLPYYTASGCSTQETSGEIFKGLPGEMIWVGHNWYRWEFVVDRTIYLTFLAITFVNSVLSLLDINVGICILGLIIGMQIKFLQVGTELNFSRVVDKV